MEKVEKLSDDTLLSEEEELFALLLAEQGFATQQTPTLRAREQTNNLPLSFAQERLWFLDQLLPDNAIYNIFVALRLTGHLNVAVLERSLHTIIQRHEALRTTFTASEGHPEQAIAPQMHIALPVLDLSSLSYAEQEFTQKALMQAESYRPFDLLHGPLLRATLVRLHTGEHIFLLTMHHIISDGWSLGVFNRELVTLYEAYCQSQPSPLPALPIQYADFALWQRQRLQGDMLQKQLQYWRGQLTGAPALLPLPTDRPRPAVQTFAGAVHNIVLSADLTAATKTLSQGEGVTLFTTLLATFQTLLSRYSEQDDISVGTYIAGRTHFETERLIGFFINNLVLRTDLSGNPSFRSLLQRASQVAQDAYAHQDVPFEHLIQELQPERNPGYTPFFQVMLIYQNMPWYAPNLSGLNFQAMNVDSTRSNFDLSLWVVEGSANLYLTFEYNTDLFDAATINRMADHFQNLLHAVVADPSQRISALPLLSEHEKRHL